MKMEQINDNTIRVLIDNDDLEERGITVLDLLGSQHQIESFFYSILEEVDVDDSFKEHDMITFQVVPNQTGLELYISKDNNINPSQFSNRKNIFKDNQRSNRQPDYSDFIKGEEYEDEFDVDDEQIESVFAFDDFENVITFSEYVYLKDGISFLHLVDDTYYVTLIQFTGQVDDIQLDSEKAMALEFAEESKISFDYVQEHGKELMQGNALQEIRGYFG